MILPVLVGFFLFRFYPLYGLQIAFKDYKHRRRGPGQPLGGAGELPQVR